MANPFQTALERYTQRTSLPSAEELGLKSELRSALQSDDPSQFDSPQDLMARMSSLESNRQAGAQKALLSRLTTLGSQGEMRTRINAQAQLSTTYMQSIAPAQLGVSTPRLEQRLEAQMGGISSRMSEMRDLSTDLSQPDVLKQYQMKVEQITRLENAAALTKTTLQSQRRLGTDPRGIMSDAEGALGRIGSQVGRFELAKKAGAGEFGSLKDESIKLANMFGTLQEATAAYIKSSTEGVDAQETAADKLKDITESITKQEGIVGAVKGAGGGFGGDQAQQIAAILSNVIGAATKTYGSVAISQPLQIMENQRRFADMYNRQYENAEAASQGDMMAMLKLGMMDDRRRQLSSSFFGKQQAVLVGQAATDLIMGSAKIGAGVATGGLAGGVVASSAAGDIGNFFTGVMDINRGVSAGRTAADAAQQYEGLFEAMQKIPAAQLQAAETFQRGTYGATTGFGGRSSSMMNQLMSQGFMRDAAGMNISPQEMLELTTVGGQTVGGGDFQAKSILSAGRAERGGILSKGQYMNLLGSLSDVGGRNESMEAILKKSVSEGMDDSKNITRMVAATTSLAEGGAMVGINAAEDIAAMMTRGFGALGGRGLTESQRTRMVAGTAGNLDRLYRQGGTDIFSLQEFAQLGDLFPEASPEQRRRLEQAGSSTVGMVRTLLNADPKTQAYQQARESLRGSGYESLLADESGALRKDKLRGFIETKGGIVTARTLGVYTTLSSKAQEAIQAARRNDKTAWNALTAIEKDTARGQFLDQGGTMEAFNAMMGTDVGLGTGEAPDVSGTFRGAMTDKLSQSAIFQQKKIKGGAEKMLDIFADEQLGLFMPGAGAGATPDQQKEFERVRTQARRAQALKRQSDMMRDITDIADVGDEERNKAIQENRAPGSILKKSAGDFSAGVDTFGKAVKKFNTLMDKMEGGASRTVVPSHDRNTTVSEADEAISMGTVGTMFPGGI